MAAIEMGVSIGDSTRFAKTVGESDVYLFAGIVGDFSANHVNEHAMKTSKLGRRIAHGALLIGFMSTCSTAMSVQAASKGGTGVALSAGYDRIRFLKPVFIGDTVTLEYVITKIDLVKRRSRASITVVNQEGVTVAVADHIMQWVD